MTSAATITNGQYIATIALAFVAALTCPVSAQPPGIPAAPVAAMLEKTKNLQPFAEPGSIPASLGSIPNDRLASATADDAGLNAICSANEDRLCAVGDRGAILLTENGGHDWQLIPSITSHHLYDVKFRTEQVGIAVGGSIGSRAGLSTGVALSTQDGGKTWIPLPHEQLARLTGVAFLGERIVAWGDYNPQLQSSLLESRDGGQTWSGISADIGHVAGCSFTPAGAYCAVDRMGRWFDVSTRAVTEVFPATEHVHRIYHDVGQWWVCGSNGFCKTSTNGLVWQDVNLPLSPLARDCWSAAAIEFQQDHIWIAGSPGSVLFRSDNGGRSWQRIETSERLPIQDIAFVDTNRGWMVGAQGAIWATRDGGHTWFPQRRRAQRVALLSMVPSNELIPWSALIAAAWDNQLPVASMALSDAGPLERADFLPDASSQLSALAAKVGIASHLAWSQTPSENEALHAQAAIAMRTWRPDVLLIHERSQPTGSNRRIDIDWQVAVEMAAATDPQFPIARELGLAAWQISKLAAVTEPTIAEYSESNSRVLKTPGITVWDLLLQLPNDHVSPDSVLPMRTVWAQSQAPITRSGLLDGIPASPELARAPFQHAMGNYQLVMGRIHRQRSLTQLVEQPQLTTARDKWRNDLEFFVKTLPETELGWLLTDQSKHALASGDFDRHQSMLELLASKRSDADITNWAIWELLRLSSSDEFQAWKGAVSSAASPADAMLAQRSSNGVSTALAIEKSSPFEQAAVSDENVGRNSNVIAASGEVALIEPNTFSVDESVNVELNHPSVADAALRSVSDNRLPWFKQLDAFAQVSPMLLNRADCKLLISRNMGLVGNETGHQQQIESLLTSTWMVGWHQAARQEMLIQRDRVQDLKWVAFADMAIEPPVLDGQLQEACWKRVPRMRLERLDSNDESNTGDAIRQPTTIAWAYDADYLYIGLDSPLRAHLRIPPAAARRVYDADLSQVDHCVLVLDTDRDYCSAVELSVAANGLTRDQCCGYAAYNPRWHVSVHAREDGWSAEIAVPLDALTQNNQLTGRAWGTSAYRARPGAETESWSTLKTHRGGLEANGLLLFVPPVE